ncbi:MAG: hypothetical protein ABEJ26_10565 [Halosimplex sp.]
MVRDSVYLAVQSVAVVALLAAVIGLFVRPRSGAAFVIAAAALVVTVPALVLGLPTSVKARVTLPRGLRIVFASQTRTVITVLAVGLLVVAGAGHAYPGPSPVTTGTLDRAGATFDLTAPNGTIDVRYTAGPPLDRAALSIRIDGRPVSASTSLAVRSAGSSDWLRPGESVVVVNRTGGRVSWTSASVTLEIAQNETLLLATATREPRTPNTDSEQDSPESTARSPGSTRDTHVPNP